MEIFQLQEIDIKQLRGTELEMLDVFTTICDRHKLRYYLNAGTLLGAVRERGFIPWDDDIDLCMPRSDYERFLIYARQELPEHIRPVWFENQNDREHPQYYCQLQACKLPMIQMIAAQPRETYAWIDIFPLDGMPSALPCRMVHSVWLLYRRARLQLTMLNTNVNLHKKDRPLYERLIIWIAKKTGWGSTGDTFLMMKKLDRALKRYSEEVCPLWINFMGAYKLKETVPASAYGSGAMYEFENRICCGPEDADLILTLLYGDYRIPIMPKDGGHHLYKRLSEE